MRKVKIPSVFYGLQKTQYDWQYKTEPSATGCLGMTDGINNWPTGKFLGGSSGINAMLYIRGNRRDYDNWAALGNPTWEWDNVLEYFKRSEDNRTPHVASNAKYHGIGGPLKVDLFNSVVPMKMVLAESVFELGYKEIYDVNGEENLGFLTAQGTVDYGSRCSAAKAFLIPAKDRPNLHIIKYAHVTKLEIDKDGSVVGVKFVVNEKTELTVRPKKEVILSAGALNTPKILMQSGIGPKSHLDQFNIKTIKDLPVGHNLQDHLIVVHPFTFHKSTAQPRSITEMVDNIYQYAMYGIGDMSHIGTTDFMGFISTVNDTKYPDIQLHTFYARKGESIGGLLEYFGSKNEIIESFEQAAREADVALFIITLLNPKSIGKLELRSNDPLDAPKIHHNYFKNEEDLDTVLRATRVLRKLTKTKTFKNHEGEFLRVNLPDCDKLTFDSDEYWKCFARHMTSTLYHPVGTAKMGPDSDEQAVVDATLKVKGIKGLRVVDASIMPKIVSGNTNAPVIMIGEKAVDFIKNDWLNQHEEL